jgi:hypothetical protein
MSLLVYDALMVTCTTTEGKMAPIKALDSNGNVFWWTGKAGQDWVSPSQADAFLGLNIEGARAKALQFNRRSDIHGLRFIAVCAD